MAKILLLEDEQAIQDEVSTWLMAEGHEVRALNDGMLGIQAISADPPDVVLCDVAMPGMNGFEVLLEVRSNPAWQLIPFVLVTAMSDRVSIRSGMNLGADDYITKPFTYKEISQAVKTQLERRAQRETAQRDQINMVRAALDHAREEHLLKSQLVALYSHEFRTPLTVIMSAAGLILHFDEHINPERRRLKLEQIVNSVGVLQQMLDDMLFVMEMESQQFTLDLRCVDIPAFLSDLVEDFRTADNNAHQITFQCNCLDQIVLDTRILRQIVSNLLSNALRYSPDGSQVSIKATCTAQEFTLSVQDQGIGITEEDLPRLFEPFYRSEKVKEKNGSGLGLAVVKRAVEICEGTIEVSSRPDFGSVFTVCIPPKTC